MASITTVFTTAPDAPSTADPDNFDARADAFLDYIETELQPNLIDFTSEINALRVEVLNASSSALYSATAAESAKDIAVQVVDSTKWVSNGTYAVGDVIYSTTGTNNGWSYRCIQANGPSPAQPLVDISYWTLLTFAVTQQKRLYIL